MEVSDSLELLNARRDELKKRHDEMLKGEIEMSQLELAEFDAIPVKEMLIDTQNIIGEIKAIDTNIRSKIADRKALWHKKDDGEIDLVWGTDTAVKKISRSNRRFTTNYRKY